MVSLRRLVVVFVALLATACQVDAVVDIEVTEDGSGLVRLTTAFDEEIVEAAPELREGLRVDDLAAAGWTVEGPRAAETGGAVVVTASKPYSSPDLLQRVLDEIAGPNGLFTDFDVVRERSFARTTYTFSGTVDPSISLETFGDETLTGLGLDGPLGLTLAELEAAAGRPLDETVNLTVNVQLPENVEANTNLIDGMTATYEVRPTDPLPTTIDVRSSVEDRLPRIWAAVALVAIALLATLLVFRVLASLAGRRGNPERDDDKVEMRRPDKRPTEPQTATAPRERTPRLELVVLDARGVLYDEANDIGARLVPFVRSRGSKASLQEINDAFRAASLGRLSTSELWAELGLDADPGELDLGYTTEFRLRDGVLDFIDRLHERGLRVAVITNNAVGWSKAIRARFDLDARVDTWVVSGEIGTRKPDAAFFEALRRMTGVEFADSLLIDDQIDDLDMARSLGMTTAMFVPSGAQLPSSSPHPVVHGFDSFFVRRQTTA